MNRTIIPAENAPFEVENLFITLGIKDADLVAVTATKDVIEIRRAAP
jgi:hypothetical protein